MVGWSRVTSLLGNIKLCWCLKLWFSLQLKMKCRDPSVHTFSFFLLPHSLPFFFGQGICVVHMTLQEHENWKLPFSVCVGGVVQSWLQTRVLVNSVFHSLSLLKIRVSPYSRATTSLPGECTNSSPLANHLLKTGHVFKLQVEWLPVVNSTVDLVKVVFWKNKRHGDNGVFCSETSGSLYKRLVRDWFSSL